MHLDRRGDDRDAALAFLIHPVGDRRAVIDRSQPMGATGVIEDAVGRRRLAGIDVGDHADVAQLGERISDARVAPGCD